MMSGGKRDWLVAVKWTLIRLWITVQLAAVANSNPEVREYCRWEYFNATCSPNEVILMQSANYGRMRFGRCVQENHGNVGCSSNVLPQLDRKCSGRHSCQMQIPDPTLHNIHPCPKELMPYLEASYVCLQVQTGSRKVCVAHGGLRVSGTSGYLASATPVEDGIGTRQCPWIVQVHSGQQINLTLYAFGTARRRQPDAAGRDPVEAPDECGSDIIITDSGRTRSISACGQIVRKRLIYMSDGYRIEIYFENSNPRIRTNFLLKYEAVGCPDLPEMKYAWSSRKGDTAIVRCNYTGETYFLSCAGSQWKGEMGNCTKNSALSAHRNADERESNFPYGLLIVIGIGVALGVAFGILMLFGILFCLKRRKMRNARGHTTDPLLSEHPPDPEEAMSNIYDKSRVVRCPHGLAAVTLNPEGLYFPEGPQRYPHVVSMTTVSTPYPGDGSETPSGERRDNRASSEKLESAYSEGARRTRANPNSSLTEAFTKRKQEMEKTFGTFRPGVVPDEASDEPEEGGYRSLHPQQPIDLIRDSRPYRELNPEMLATECTCSLRHSPSHTCTAGERLVTNADSTKINTAV